MIKHGDTHEIYVDVYDKGRQPVNLSGATVRLLCREQGDSSAPAELPCQVTNPAAGEITHVLTGTLGRDTETVAYELEVEIDREGKITTAPSRGRIVLYVEPDLR